MLQRRAVAMLQALGIDHDTTDDQIRELAVRNPLSVQGASMIFTFRTLRARSSAERQVDT